MAKFTRKKFQGRDHWVVPTVLLVEGVHEGSQGPIYYPPNEMKRSARLWNGKPVVVYHPKLAGATTASVPEVFEAQHVGTLFNTRYKNRRLVAEAWLDTKRLNAVDPRVSRDLRAGRMIEVSTGLFTERKDADDVWNGEPYTAVAYNYQPDHLAILPDMKGACSIADGAGLLRNSVPAYA